MRETAQSLFLECGLVVVCFVVASVAAWLTKRLDNARDKRRERKGEKECERIEHRSSKGEIARSSVAILSTIDRARERTPASIKRAFPDLRCR